MCIMLYKMYMFNHSAIFRFFLLSIWCSFAAMALISLHWCKFAHTTPLPLIARNKKRCRVHLKKTNKHSDSHTHRLFFACKKKQIKMQFKRMEFIAAKKYKQQQQHNIIFVNKIVIYIWICISRRVYSFEMLTFSISLSLSLTVSLLLILFIPLHLHKFVL